MKILSISGGGTLGYIAATILKHLEDEIGDVTSKFDMIAGISTGSLLGYAIANGYTPDEACKLYRELAPKIFKKKAGFLKSLFRPLYDIKDLETALKAELGDLLVSDTRCKFMTFAVDVHTKDYVKPKFWKSWRDENKYDLAVTALTASSAAPLYFSPYEINGQFYVDGALCSNNPSMAAVAESLKLGNSLQDIKLISIGLNKINSYSRPIRQLSGLINVARNSTQMALWGTEKLVVHQARTLLRDNFLYINGGSGLIMDSLDFDQMEKEALEVWNANKDALVRLAS